MKIIVTNPEFDDVIYQDLWQFEAMYQERFGKAPNLKLQSHEWLVDEIPSLRVTLDDSDLDKLRSFAEQTGDSSTVGMCDAAKNGNSIARIDCAAQVAHHINEMSNKRNERENR